MIMVDVGRGRGWDERVCMERNQEKEKKAEPKERKERLVWEGKG